MRQHRSERFISGLVNSLLVLKPDFHFCGMYVYIHLISLNVVLQADKGVFMLHHIGLIGILYGLHEHLAFYISAVNIIIFKGSVASCNDRLSRKSLYGNPVLFILHGGYLTGYIPAVNAVDDILQAGIAGAVKLCLSVYHEFKRDVLMGQSELFHIGTHITGFCHGCL